MKAIRTVAGLLVVTLMLAFPGFVIAEEAGDLLGQVQIVEEADAPVVSGSAHVQKLGWVDAEPGQDGYGSVVFGTTGQALRLESIRMNVAEGGVSYTAHVQGKGWIDWVSDGVDAGTTGESKRLEAIRIKLDSSLARMWSVQYRCHVQGFGWMGWAADGDIAGSSGYGKRMEAVEVRIVPVGTSLPAGDGAAWRDNGLHANAHVQGTGWTGDQRGFAVTLGTTGQSKRIEAFTLAKPDDFEGTGDIVYSAHVQGIGWQEERTGGQVAGTTGEARRVEAVTIDLTGELAATYDVWYRVHAQGVGWLDWAQNGEVAGTCGFGKRLEAIEIRLVAEGSDAPGRTDFPALDNVSGNFELDVALRSILRDVTGTGPDALRAAYDYVSNTKFKNYGYTPSPEEDWEEWSKPLALELYTNGNGNCYRSCSLLTWIARALDYDAICFIGRIANSNNRYTVHSWTEIRKNGVVYVCDPALQQNMPDYDFFMQTYEEAPVYFYDWWGNPMSSWS